MGKEPTLSLWGKKSEFLHNWIFYKCCFCFYIWDTFSSFFTCSSLYYWGFFFFFFLRTKIGRIVFLLVHNKTNIKNATSSSLVAPVFFLIAAVYLNFQIKCSCWSFCFVTFPLVSNKHITDILRKAIHSRFYPRNILHSCSAKIMICTKFCESGP